jgi:hypothetical protein
VEYEYQVIQPCLVDLTFRFFIDTAQVATVDLGAEGAGQRTDMQPP